MINIVLVLLFPAFCLLLGYWVVLARPLEWNAWFLLGIINIFRPLSGPTGYFPGFLTPFTVFWQIFAIQWMFVSLILFDLLSRPLPNRHRHPWIKWLLIVPLILILPARFAIEYGLL